MAETERVICRTDELTDGGLAMRFNIAIPESPAILPCFAIAYDGNVHAYVNSCPHRGTELDWQPGEVFEETGLYLICATHGAVFEPDSGLCVGGPCHGARLRTVAIEIVGNDVMLSGFGVEIRNEKSEP